jgi:hypothetical protein
VAHPSPTSLNDFPLCWAVAPSGRLFPARWGRIGVMEENPYKSPETRGSASGRFQLSRIPGTVFCAAGFLSLVWAASTNAASYTTSESALRAAVVSTALGCLSLVLFAVPIIRYFLARR